MPMVRSKAVHQASQRREEDTELRPTRTGRSLLRTQATDGMPRHERSGVEWKATALGAHRASSPGVGRGDRALGERQLRLGCEVRKKELQVRQRRNKTQLPGETRGHCTQGCSRKPIFPSRFSFRIKLTRSGPTLPTLLHSHCASPRRSCWARTSVVFAPFAPGPATVPGTHGGFVLL